MKKIKLLNGKIYKACELDNNENVVYEGSTFPKIIDGSILFPSRLDADFLYAKMKEMGTLAFQQEYLNNPVDFSTSVIKRVWIEKCLDSSVSMDELARWDYDYKVLGVDFAFSDAVIADKSAFVSLGRKKNKYYLFQGSTKKGMSVLDQFDYIKEGLHIVWKYDKIALEENSIRNISKDVDQLGLPIKLYWTGARDSRMRLKPDVDFEGKTNTVGKTSLIQRVARLFEMGEIVLPYKTEKDKNFVNTLIDECLSFALSDGKLVEAGVHPDIPIALGYANEAMLDNSSGLAIV
jgi:phage terminase large subunit-like protein